MVPMQTLHHPQRIPQLKILKTHSTLLPPVEQVVSGAPLHPRNASYLFGGEPLRPGCLWEEGTLIGLFHAGVLVVRWPTVPVLTVCRLLLKSILLIPIILPQDVLLGILLTVPIVDLTALRLLLAIIAFLLEGMGRMREALRRHRKSQIIEDSHIEGDELLEGGLTATEKSEVTLLRTGEGVLRVRIATHQQNIIKLASQSERKWLIEVRSRPLRMDKMNQERGGSMGWSLEMTHTPTHNNEYE